MTDIKRGPFGRKGDGRSLACQCSGCCDREWEDFPDTIEFRIATTGLVTRPFNYKGLMYKDRKNQFPCTCGNAVGIISYSSPLIKILDDTWPEDDSETCCLVISIQGACSSGQGPTFDPIPGNQVFPPYDPPLAFGECGWVVGFTWTGGDALGVSIDVTPNEQNPGIHLASCDPIEVEGPLGGIELVPACILGNSINPDLEWEIKEAGVAGGDTAEPCKFLCWATLDDTLYATLTSSCEELDGQVVELRHGNQAWSGDITVGTCERYTIIVLQHERREESETCPLFITVKSSNDGAECIYDLQNLGLAPAPPSWGAGGTIAAVCGCKCGGHTIDIDITE